MFEEMTRAPEAVAAATLADQTFRDYRPVLSDIRIPTLVCRGAKSPQPESGARMLLEANKAATLRTFEYSAHCPFLEEPDLFNAALLDFAAEVCGGSSRHARA